MKNLSKFYMILLACMLVGFTACDSATEEGREYGDIDLNGDASLDDQEFGTAWGDDGYYDRWDTNTDGFLDETEWNARRGGLEGYTGNFSDWDSDADNRLSEDEFRGGIYGHYDRDGDRMINEEEYNAWYREGR